MIKHIYIIGFIVISNEMFAGALDKVKGAMNQGVGELTGLGIAAATLAFVVGALYYKINVHVGKNIMVGAVVGLALVIAGPSIIKGVAELLGFSS